MRHASLAVLCLLNLGGAAIAADAPAWISSAQSGPWSAATTWVGGQAPAAAARVHVKAGHVVEYDVQAETPIRVVFVAGTLRFSTEKDTQLNVGLLRIEASETPSEEGFDCDTEHDHGHHHGPQAALQVGAPDKPIPAGRKALIRLIAVEGQDPQSCPAIVCCAAKMDFHGAPLSRTWVKLGATAKKGDSAVTLEEAVTGWRVGDRVIVTATKLGRDNGGSEGDMQTEERVIRALDGLHVTLNEPLVHEHLGEGEFRGEIANLSRNVIVESAAPKGVRGHTMYHRNSAGSISYAEFRHLGKKNVLGRYALHYHLVGSTMRGSYVQGASIWDSDNRWLTIHGTNYLVIRDCIGFRSVGHGFFMEDGTEVLNTLDRNLAVQSMEGKKLPKQVLPFDQNEGSGYWWANSANTFTRNVACENNRYGFRFEAMQTSQFNPTLPIQHADGKEREVDIRTLPFVRFDDNEAHCDGLYGINLGEGVNRVGPDARHPFVMRNTKIWEIHYAFRPQSPSLLVEGLKIHRSIYGVYHPNFDRHVYKDVVISQSGTNGDAEPFNRGHDDDDTQYGLLTVDGLTFVGHRHSSMPLIQISDHNPTGSAESHFRNVQVTNRQDQNRRALVNLGGGPRPAPKTPTSVPVYLYDYFGPGRHAKVVSVKSSELKGDEAKNYRAEPPLTGDESRVTEVNDVKFPQLLDPVDDLPPATVISSVLPTNAGLRVRGYASDNGVIRQVLVNSKPATALRDNFAEWEITLVTAGDSLSALATDAAGNQEQTPHVVRLAGH